MEHEPDEGADRGTILNCSDVQGAGIWEATKACDDILAGVETGPGNNEGNVTWSLFDGRDRVLYETFPADGRESWHAAHSSGGALRLRVETSPDFTGPLAAAIYCT